MAKLRTDLAKAWAPARPLLWIAGLFTLASALALAMPVFYVMQLQSRVLHSGSIETLLTLSIILVIALGTASILRVARARLLMRAAGLVDSRLSEAVVLRLFEHSMAQPGEIAGGPLGDLERLRVNLGAKALPVLFDLLLILPFLLIATALQPYLGLGLAAVLTLQLLLMLVGGGLATRGILRQQKAADAQVDHTTLLLRHGDQIVGMGLADRLARRWRTQRQRHLAAFERQIGHADLLREISLFTLAVGLAALVAGASWLVVTKGGDAAVLIGVLLAGGAALLPLHNCLANWPMLMATSSAYRNLRSFVGQFSARRGNQRLPNPIGRLTFENVSYAIAHNRQAIVRDISFVVEPGEIMAVIGATGSGKSEILRLASGQHKPTLGHARLDGGDIYAWQRDDLFQHVGYLPQEAELLPGTIAENIASFRPIEAELVIDAARKAGAHDMILRLPFGYDTRLDGEEGALSPGLRYRVALARALYGRPRVLLLDEPGVGLDNHSEEVLVQVLHQLKLQGTTIVVVSNRRVMMPAADKLLWLKDGAVAGYGPAATVLDRIESVQRQARPAKPRITVVRGNDGEARGT